MNSFIAHTQEELQELGIIENHSYKIQYQNKDYFNGETTLEFATATAVKKPTGEIIFLVPDSYGMDQFIDKVRVIR